MFVNVLATQEIKNRNTTEENNPPDETSQSLVNYNFEVLLDFEKKCVH